jgi:hypothetical protein
MFKYLFVALIARFVASTFEPGRWREIAHVRAKSYGDMIDRMGFKIEKKRRNLKFKSYRYQCLRCDGWVNLRPSRVLKTDARLVFEALQPWIVDAWYSFSPGVKATYCVALQRSIEYSRYDIEVGIGEQMSHLDFIRKSYMAIAAHLATGSDFLHSQIIELLEMASSFEARRQCEEVIQNLLKAYPLSSADVDYNQSLLWPKEQSQEVLRELMTDVITEGSGEDKIILFLNKMFANMEISKAALSLIAQTMLGEFKDETKIIGHKLYLLETEALTASD